jgi:hypothetical protein
VTLLRKGGLAVTPEEKGVIARNEAICFRKGLLLR